MDRPRSKMQEKIYRELSWDALVGANSKSPQMQMEEERRARIQDWALCNEMLRGLLFPRRCPFCERVIGYLAFCDEPACVALCQAQKRSSKKLDSAAYYLGDLAGAAAVYAHKSAPRRAVLHLKYSGKRGAGRTLGNIMAKELFGCTFFRKYGIVIPNKLQTLAGYHYIIPVPPSDDTRGYNVPTLLADAFRHAFGVPVLPDALQRVRFTKRQASLSFEARFANVAGAFVARSDLDLVGKDVILVDDVITTGATVTACAQALYKAGAQSVFAVSFTAGTKKDIGIEEELE